MTLPKLLTGYRVLDLSRILAGPYCTMMLGDLGAEVIKIEHPKSGDPTRQWGPPFYTGGNKDAVYFHAFNRNKKSVCVDFSKPDGAKLIQEIAKKCDILVENFVPGSLKKYNLDFITLNNINPDLVYCSITGFGQSGPSCLQPGYDLIAAAAAGLLSITGPLEEPVPGSNGHQLTRASEPCRVGVAITDLTTGLYAKSSILAALVPRRKIRQDDNTGLRDDSQQVLMSDNTPRGCHIDANLLATQIALNSHVAANFLTCNQQAYRMGTSHPSLVPYRAYLTLDSRELIVGVGSDAQFLVLCRLLDRPEWASAEAGFQANADRVRQRSCLDSMIGARISELPLADWLTRLAGSGLPHGPINHISEVFDDPQVRYHWDKRVISWDFAASGPGNQEPLRVPGPAVDIALPGNAEQRMHQTSLANAVQFTRPPQLAEHTRDVLATVLGVTEKRLEELAKRGIVRLAEQS